MSDEKPPVLSEEQLDAMVTVKVNGAESQVRVRDLVPAYQKRAAADEDLRTIAEVRKRAEAADEFRESILTRDQVRMQRAFKSMGFSDDQVAALMAADPSEPADDDDDEPVRPDPALTNRIERMEKGLETLLTAFNTAKETSSRRKHRDEILDVVDKDEELSKIMSSGSKEDKQFLTDLAEKFVTEASKEYPWGPRAIQVGLENLKKRLLSLRGSANGSASDDLTDDLVPAGFGQGAAGRTATQLHHRTNEKRVPVNDPSYSQNVFERLGRYMRGR